MTTTETGKREPSYAADKRVRARLVSELNASRERERVLQGALREAAAMYRRESTFVPREEWRRAENEAIRSIHGQAVLEVLLRWEALLGA